MDKIVILPPQIVNIQAVLGVTPPAIGATPVTKIKDTAHYTGTVAWAVDFFKVAGAEFVINDADSGVITAVFRKTVKPAYSVTTLTNDNGTASANPASAVEGTAVTLSAVADSGYYIKEWE